MKIDEQVLAGITERFHSLIAQRARQGGIPVPADLPTARDLLNSRRKEAWFPVPGMCGGFAYRLVGSGPDLKLDASSWCRVADGSGQRHEITADAITLAEEGFV